MLRTPVSRWQLVYDDRDDFDMYEIDVKYLPAKRRSAVGGFGKRRDDC